MVGGVGGGGPSIPAGIPQGGPTGEVQTVTTPDGQPVVGDAGSPPSTPSLPAAQYDGTVQGRSNDGGRPQDPGDLGTTVFNSVFDVGDNLGNTDLAGLQNIASGVKAKVEGFQAQMDGLKAQIKVNTEIRDTASTQRAELLSQRGNLDLDSDEGKDKAAQLDKQIAGLDTIIKVADKNIDEAQGKLEDLRGDIDKVVDQGRAECQKLLKEVAARENAKDSGKGKDGGQKPADQTALAKTKETVLSTLNTLDLLSTAKLGEIVAAAPEGAGPNQRKSGATGA